MPRALTLLVLCGLFAVASPGGARDHVASFRIAGRPWPGHTITFFNTVRDQERAVEAGAAAWNQSGANVKFVAVSRAKAEVVILPIPLNYPIVDAGHATAGRVGARDEVHDPYPKLRYAKDGRPLGLDGEPTTYHGAHMWIRHANDRFGGHPDTAFWARIAAHELGHVLGLGHETRGCAAMHPHGFQSPRCATLQTWQHFCGALLADDDIRGAVQLYGGRPEPKPIETCDDTVAPLPPGGVAAELSASGTDVRLVWTLPQPSVKLLGVIIKRGHTCPTDVGDTANLTYKPQGPYFSDLPSPGMWCYSIWTVRTNGQPSAQPGTASLDVPAPGP